MKSELLNRANFWLPPILWALLIYNFSSGSIPVASSIYWQDFAVKKTGHVLLFGILALLIYRALLGEGISKSKSAIWAILLAFFYGASDELHQVFTQGREARVRDVFIDGLGAAAFISFVYYLLPKLPQEIKIIGRRFGFK